MSLAAAWPLSGEMPALCGAVLLVRCADTYVHTGTWSRTCPTMCQATLLLKSFSMVQKNSAFRTDPNQSPKQSANSWALLIQLLLHHSYLHRPKLTIQNSFPRTKIGWSTKEKKKKQCNRNTCPICAVTSIIPCLTHSCGNFPQGKTQTQNNRYQINRFSTQV